MTHLQIKQLLAKYPIESFTDFYPSKTEPPKRNGVYVIRWGITGKFELGIFNEGAWSTFSANPKIMINLKPDVANWLWWKGTTEESYKVIEPLNVVLHSSIYARKEKRQYKNIDNVFLNSGDLGKVIGAALETTFSINKEVSTEQPEPELIEDTLTAEDIAELEEISAIKEKTMGVVALPPDKYGVVGLRVDYTEEVMV